MALSNEQILAAADALEAKGLPSTLAGIRKHLGGGSFTTISEAMAQRRAQRLPKATHDPLPHVVADQLGALGQTVWAAASAQANDRLNSDRDQFNLQSAQLEAARNEAAELANQATADLEEAELRIDALGSTIDGLRRDHAEKDAKLAIANEHLAASKARADESDKRISDLNRELERVNTTHSDLIRALTDSGRHLPDHGIPNGDLPKGQSRHARPSLP